MSNLIPSSGNDKISWDKPEGKLGKFVAALGVGALGFGLYKILPFLATMAWNAVSFTVAVFILLLLIALLTSKKFWSTLSTGYLILMHKILYAFVSSDPIAILNDYIHKLELQIENVDKAMKNFRGLIEQNKRRLRETEEKLQDNIAKRKHYEKQGKTEFLPQIDQMILLHEQNKQSRLERLQTSERWMEALEKVREYAKFSVNTNREKISVFKEQYQEAKEAAKAAKSLKNAVHGNPNLVENFEVAMEVMEQQMSANIGEVEDMLQATTGLLREADLERGIASERAQEILARYDRKEGMFNQGTWEMPALSGQPEQPIIITRQKGNNKKGRYFN